MQAYKDGVRKMNIVKFKRVNVEEEKKIHPRRKRKCFICGEIFDGGPNRINCGTECSRLYNALGAFMNKFPKNWELKDFRYTGNGLLFEFERTKDFHDMCFEEYEKQP